MKKIETVLNKETIQFMYQAFQRNVSLYNLLENPKTVSRELQLKLSRDVENRIFNLKEIKKKERARNDDFLKTEIISFYNKVLIDGRFMEEWTQHPGRIAEALNIDISAESIRKIEEIDFTSIINLDDNIEETTAAITAVVAVVTFGAVFPPSSADNSIQPIVDRSGRIKL